MEANIHIISDDSRDRSPSLKPDFPDFSQSICSHWGVENQLHWCLDVIFAEDDSRIRKDHAPQNMTILKRLALNFLRQDNFCLLLVLEYLN